jgi:hypothetical protein
VAIWLRSGPKSVPVLPARWQAPQTLVNTALPRAGSPSCARRTAG